MRLYVLNHCLRGKNLLLVFILCTLFSFLSPVHSLSRNHKNQHVEQLQSAESVATRSNGSSAGFDVLEILQQRDLLSRDTTSSNSSGQTGGGSSASSSADFTCGPDKPCGNGACCGASGWCGYEPKYCGDGCQSNCDATAECGKYASPSGKTCPLNVCCSEYGFCGTTSEFCQDGCQGDCEQPRPSPQATNVQKKIIAYYEGWNANHACGTMTPEEIPVDSISHLILAFGYITPDDFEVTNMDEMPPEIFKQIADQKSRNHNLKIMVALGGWTFTDPGIYQSVFTDIVSTESNRQNFIQNLLGFLSQYGFDGVDFDWEYPGADDRGGQPNDGINYTQMLKELRTAIKSSGVNYIVTFTAPTSYWYLQHFDIKAMTTYVDWINLMSYDLHGVWDRDNPIGNRLLAHSNLTEIDLALDLFWRNDIDPSSIVLGMGFYGRSFKLEDTSCWKPGCAFSGAGDEGPCTKTGGILSYKEITDILADTNAKASYDDDAQVAYFVYGQNNWISFDNAKSFQAKIDFANNRGLSGLMIWAIDLDDAKHSALSALTGDQIADSISPLALTDDSATVAHSTNDPSKCRITDCDGFCTQAETAVGRVKAGCKGSSSHARWICCPAWTSLKPDDCRWDSGRGAVKTDCSGQCSIGEIKVTGDSDGWKGDLKTGDYDFHCLRGGKSFCCKSGNLQQYLDICTWTTCGGTCPSDKQNVLTTDSGGPSGEGPRCSKQSGFGGGSPFDPGSAGGPVRKLCCPSATSFKNCAWKGANVCSESCSDYQITLDVDPQGSDGGKYCDNGRNQVFCCDAPGGANHTFLPVDLDRIFPPEYLPAADSIPSYDLVGFGGRAAVGDADPNQTGVAFFLMAGSSTVTGSLRKREAPGLHFLDCPSDILTAPLTEKQKVRLVCLSGELETCFNFRKGGVEGTVVHMPDECGGGSFARAVELEPSQNQSVPVNVVVENPSVSAVYDFYFDYNNELIRRDGGPISIRIDYSNVAGYWDAVVDSPGVGKRDLETLVNRFYSDNRDDWANTFNKLSPSASTSTSVSQDLTQLVYYHNQSCPTSQGSAGEGIAVGIEGNAKIDAYYGFSMIATWDPSSTVQVHEANGFYHAEGSTSAKFRVGGIGTFDSSQKLTNGDVITKTFGKVGLGGHSIFHGWASFEPYMQQGVRLKTAGAGSDNNAASFNGYMEASVVEDWGDFNIAFPSDPTEQTIKSTVVSKGDSVLAPLSGDTPSSAITVVNTIQLGLKVSLAFQRPWQFAVTESLPDMAITQALTASFQFQGSSSSVCLDTFIGVEGTTQMTDGNYVGWGDSYDRTFVSKLDQVGGTDCFSATANSRREESEPSTPAAKRKRQQNNTPGPPWNPYGNEISLQEYLQSDLYNGRTQEVNCGPCETCLINPELADCCGCVWLAPETNIFGSIPIPGIPGFSDGNLKRSILDYTKDTTESEPFYQAGTELVHMLDGRGLGGINDGEKRIAICDQPPIFSDPYPAYPDYYRNPATTQGAAFEHYYPDVKKYFHNSSTVCTSFDVAEATTFDQVYTWPKQGVRGTSYHQTYQTEHVFESQTIARFFTSWLPSAAAMTQRTCTWTTSWFLRPNTHWGMSNYNQYNSPMNLMMDELGSNNHLERLTVLLTRVNTAKGRFFGAKTGISSDTFGALNAGDEQLLAAREIGMIFTYMNIDTVWESFCDSYNGMLTFLEKFDDDYEGLGGGTTSVLALEWPNYIRSELDRVVTDARTNMKLLDQTRKSAGILFANRWSTVMSTNGEMSKVKLERTDKCRNLPASSAGPWLG